MTPPMDSLLPGEHFEPHRRRLTDLARRWLGNQADAEDAVQDAYLRVQGALPGTKAGAEAWLVTVLRHLCIDRLRRRRIEQREAALHEPLDTQAPSAEHLAGLSLETIALLRRLVRRLRPPDVAAVLLYAVFDFDHAEIARLSGQAEAASRQRWHRALQRVRQAREDEDAAGDRESADVLLGLCWRALQSHSAAPLVAVIREAAVTARAGAASPAAGGIDTTRTTATLHQVDGRFALALALDGVVLCTLPVGLCDERCATADC